MPFRKRCTKRIPPFRSTASFITARLISQFLISLNGAQRSAAAIRKAVRGAGRSTWGAPWEGRTFELAKEFEQVTGIDFSARFIRIALQLKEKGVMHYELPEEGEIVSYHEARLSELGLDRVADRVEFVQGDATNLKPQFAGYDLALAANLIDRLQDPRRFLETIHERMNTGGVLVVASPYTWLEEFTKKENWLGGFRKVGEPYMTLDAIRELLSVHFVMLEEPQELEFVIRETRRKFQHTVAELTVWERVS